MEEHPQSQEIHDRLHRLEHEERRLWRIVLLFLALMAAALAATQWEHFTSLPQQIGDVPGLKALPTGTFVLVVLFALIEKRVFAYMLVSR